MLQFCLTLLFAAHLLCMNVAGAGPAVALWFEWREGRNDPLSGRVGRFLAGLSLLLFVLGAVLGLAYGWTKWTPEYRQALGLVESRVSYGIWELLFSVVLMALHWVWWRAAPTCSKVARGFRMLLPLLASTNLLYHFPFLFIILAQLLAGDIEATKPLTSAEFRARMADGLVLARVTHFWLASFAVSGMALVAYSLHLARLGAPAADADRVAIWGGRVALAPTLAQIPVGLWVLSQMPADRQTLLLGGDLVGTSLFGASVLLAAWLMHLLAGLALGDARPSLRIRSLIAMTLVVALMSGTLARV